MQRLLDASESADCGEPRRHEWDLATVTRDPDFDLDHNAWLITAGGSIAAAGWVWMPLPTGEITADHYVHPDHRGRGLGDALLDTIEGRAVELAANCASEASPALLEWCEDVKRQRLSSLVARGFLKSREYFSMRLDLRGALATSELPPGIEVRPLRLGPEERLVHAADQEAFAQHHLFEVKAFEDWRRHVLERPDSDPSLWLIAWDGDQVAGFLAATSRDDGALIDDFAVRPAWRGRGVGLGLLLAEFSLLRRRGVDVVRLFVDAQNVTRAAALYEKAGMQVERRFDVMQKALG